MPPRYFTLAQQAAKIWSQNVALSAPLGDGRICKISKIETRRCFIVSCTNTSKSWRRSFTRRRWATRVSITRTLRHRERAVFSSADRGDFNSMMFNWKRDVTVIVVTDGSRILGLGDLGMNGMGISQGKLDLYVAGGGFDPQPRAPVVLDVGTNNPDLLNDPYYLGSQHARLEGQEYDDFIDEFIRGVRNRWPNALIQFEDFQTKHANTILERYRRDTAVLQRRHSGHRGGGARGSVRGDEMLGRSSKRHHQATVRRGGRGERGMRHRDVFAPSHGGAGIISRRGVARDSSSWIKTV